MATAAQREILRTDRDDEVADPERDRVSFRVFSSAKVGEYFKIWTGEEYEIGKKTLHTAKIIFHPCHICLQVEASYIYEILFAKQDFSQVGGQILGKT